MQLYVFFLPTFQQKFQISQQLSMRFSIRYASIIEHERLKAETKLCPAGSYFIKFILL